MNACVGHFVETLPPRTPLRLPLFLFSHSSILTLCSPRFPLSPIPHPSTLSHPQPPPPPPLTHTLSYPPTCCLCGGGAYGSPRSKHGGGKGVQQRAALHCGIQRVSVCEGKEKKGLDCQCHTNSDSSCHQQYRY